MRSWGKLWKKARSFRLPTLRLRPLFARHRDVLLRVGRIGIAIGGIGLVVLLIHREVYSLIVGRPEYTVDTQDLRVSLSPEWAGGKYAIEVDLNPARRSLFDADLLAEIARAFERNPWVGRVASVDRVFPEEVRVRFEYRRPYAAVRTAEGWIALDRDRVRLPGVWTDRPPCVLTSDIVGVQGAPEAGRRWEDAAIRSGMTLAELVSRDQTLRRAGITQIDVSNYAGRIDRRQSEIVFATRSACRIHWGRHGERQGFGALSTEEKLRNLGLVLRDYPDLKNLVYAKIYYRRGEAAVRSREGQLGRGR